jgi:hypothetical protein
MATSYNTNPVERNDFFMGKMGCQSAVQLSDGQIYEESGVFTPLSKKFNQSNQTPSKVFFQNHVSHTCFHIQ